MVGHVEESGQAAGFDDGNHLLPLCGGDVIACGVVAAGVQQHNRAFSSGVQRSQHPFKVDATQAAVGAGIKVGIGFYGEACIAEQGTVVFPAGVRNQHFGVGSDFFQEICTNFQAACTANGLHGGDTTAFHDVGIRTEHQAFHGSVISGNPINRQIAACGGFVHHGFFSRLYAFEQREFAVVVEINTHAEVDFVGVGVGSVLLVQTQNRVAGGHFDSRKQ